MTIRGKREGAAALCTAITDREFVMLARDILVIRGHSEIRITDGPGDGFRDIHSRDPNGELCVTQVAHSRNPHSTIASRKMAELPAGMIKFGAKAGLFITSARISPQGKREFLGDFPGMTLDFLDGDALADEILRNVPLKAVWYDGVEFGRVSNCVLLPFLLRDLRTDRPLQLSAELSSEPWPSLGEGAEIASRERWVHASAFNPYRQPEAPGLHEGLSSKLRVHEFVFSGDVSLDSLERHQPTLQAAIAQRVRRMTNSPLIALRFGQAEIVPLQGKWSGTSVPFGPSPYTVLATLNDVVHEWTWLAEVGPEWLRPTEVRATTADWVRRLHADDEFCFAVALITTATDESRWQTSAMDRMIRRDWERSVFCLVEPNRLEQLHALEPPPTEHYQWVDGREFVIWSLRDLVGPFANLAWADDCEQGPFEQRENEIRECLDRVRCALQASGHEVIAPHAARHMRALVASDPYPTEDMMYRFVDIEFEARFPSPIDPRGRVISLDACWRLIDEPSDETFPRIKEWFAEWRRAASVHASSYFLDVDQAQRPGWFVRLHVVDEKGDPMNSTNDRLRAFANETRPKFKTFEEGLRARGIAARGATREYWFVLCDTVFHQREDGR